MYLSHRGQIFIRETTGFRSQLELIPPQSSLEVVGSLLGNAMLTSVQGWQYPTLAHKNVPSSGHQI